MSITAIILFISLISSLEIVESEFLNPLLSSIIGSKDTFYPQEALVFFVYKKEYIQGGALLSDEYALTLYDRPHKVQSYLLEKKIRQDMFIGIPDDVVNLIDERYLHQVLEVIKVGDGLIDEKSENCDPILAIVKFKQNKHGLSKMKRHILLPEIREYVEPIKTDVKLQSVGWCLNVKKGKRVPVTNTVKNLKAFKTKSQANFKIKYVKKVESPNYLGGFLSHQRTLQAMVFKITQISHAPPEFTMDYINIEPHCHSISKATSGKVTCPPVKLEISSDVHKPVPQSVISRFHW